jgi:AcrR family transcriptional regulator
MYQLVRGVKVDHQNQKHQADLIDRCLNAFIEAGTFDLSLDKLADAVGISKRMLVHYFDKREVLEERAMALLEDRLRAKFAPERFPSGVSARTVISALWKAATDPASRKVLQLVMDVSRRAWRGSPRARSFYAEQQRLWTALLMQYLPDRNAVADLLQCFQGAILAYLITGDPEPGRRMMLRLTAASLKGSKVAEKRKRFSVNTRRAR